MSSFVIGAFCFYVGFIKLISLQRLMSMQDFSCPQLQGSLPSPNQKFTALAFSTQTVLLLIN